MQGNDLYSEQRWQEQATVYHKEPHLVLPTNPPRSRNPDRSSSSHETDSQDSVPMPSYKASYLLHNSAGPLWYSNHHLIPPSSNYTSFSDSFLSPFVPPFNASGVEDYSEDATGVEDCSEDGSDVEDYSEDGSDMDSEDGSDMEDYPEVGSDMEDYPEVGFDMEDYPEDGSDVEDYPEGGFTTVDILDDTNPWGPNWHHDSPYDLESNHGPVSTDAHDVLHIRSRQLLRSASATHLRSKVDIALPDVVGTRDDLEIKYRPIATDTQNGLHILPLEPNLTAGTASEKEKRGSVLGRLAKKFSLMKKPLSDQRREDDQQAPLALDDDVQAYSFDLPLPLGRLAVANPDLELDHDIQADSSLDVPLSLGWLRVANPDTTGSEKNLSFPENLPLLSKQPGTPKPLILNTPMFRFAFPAPSLPPSQCSKVISTLCNIFEEPASYRRLLKCTGRDAQVALDICQMLLDSCELSNSVGGQIIAAMQRLAAKTQLYPQRLILRSPVTLLDKDTVDAGGFGDIYKATLHSEVLCLKVVRTSRSQAARMAKLFAKEGILWSQLSHCNVLPFYGLYFVNSQNSFVSPWAENGNIGEYLKSARHHPNRLLLSVDIAAGVSYLHSRGMVHGDLKPANVLVDRSGRAYLTDFGLSSVDDPLIAHWATQSSVASKGGTPRYQAPELHQTESDDDDTHDSGVIHNTPKSDVFALGCLLYEVFTGTVPFFESPNHYTVVYKVMNGKTPSRPKEGSTAWLKHGLTDEIWDVMEDCWKFDPAERTDMTSVLSRLDSMKPADHRPAPQWPVGTSMRFRNSQGVDPCQPCSSLEDLNMILQRIIHGLGNHVSAKL